MRHNIHCRLICHFSLVLKILTVGEGKTIPIMRPRYAGKWLESGTLLKSCAIHLGATDKLHIDRRLGICKKFKAREL